MGKEAQIHLRSDVVGGASFFCGSFSKPELGTPKNSTGQIL